MIDLLIKLLNYEKDYDFNKSFNDNLKLIYGNNETFRFNEENIKEIYSSIRNMAEEQKFIEVIEKALCFWGKVYSNRLISS
jgi:hypothetical protein